MVRRVVGPEDLGGDARGGEGRCSAKAERAREGLGMYCLRVIIASMMGC